MVAKPIFPQTPYVKSLSLAAQTACTTRAPTVTASLAGANIVEFVPTSTNGLRIDSIEVKNVGTGITTAGAANIVGIWIWDGTTAYLHSEIEHTAVTPSTTAKSGESVLTFGQPLNLPASYKLYASVTVTTTAAGTALQVTARGASY